MNCWICQEHETCPFPICYPDDDQNIAPNEAKARAAELGDKNRGNMRNDNETALPGF